MPDQTMTAVQVLKEEIRILDDLNQLSASAKHVLNTMLQQLEHTDYVEQHNDAIRLYNQADYAATAIQNAIAAPATARPPIATTHSDLAGEVGKIRSRVQGNRMASSLDTGTNRTSQEYDQYLNGIAQQAATIAEDSLELHRQAFQHDADPSVDFICCMAVISMDNIVGFTEALRPKPSISRVIIPA